MEDKDYLDSFEDYLERHPGFDAGQAALLKDIYEELDEDVYKFIMNAIVG
ncbi:MAG: DUF1441 family protein [Clostridiales Family XIII bacterium]|jgi:hypothetical protein|nr:DUF1441 family protein [Clostridiales Family XIII bacterium]